MKKFLNSWDVHDSESLKQVLDWLLDKGRRYEFNQIRNYLHSIPEDDRHTYIESLPNETEEKYKTTLTNYYFRRLPAEGIAAFDYAFCILLSDHGKKLGYLNKEESWDYKVKAAGLAQKSYSSWFEYTNGFHVGVLFMGNDQASADSYVKEQQPITIKLIASRHSPFQQVKWDEKI
jgi:hypothetical protein